MDLRIQDVYLFSMAVKAILDFYKIPFVVYAPTYALTWETVIYIPAIDATITITDTGVIRATMKADTGDKRIFMKNISPILIDFEYKAGLCIADHSITQSMKSFGLPPLREGINTGNYPLFHLSYEATIAQIALNLTALEAKGFAAADMADITTNHDSAMLMATSRVELKIDSKTLTIHNADIINTVMTINMELLEALHAFGAKTGNAELKAMATGAAVLRSIRSTPVKKMRNLHLKKTTSRIYQTDFVQRNTMQLLNGGKGFLSIVHSNSKVGPYSGGMELPPDGKLRNLKLKDIPGFGKYVVIYSDDTENDGLLGSLILKG